MAQKPTGNCPLPTTYHSNGSATKALHQLGVGEKNAPKQQKTQVNNNSITASTVAKREPTHWEEVQNTCLRYMMFINVSRFTTVPVPSALHHVPPGWYRLSLCCWRGPPVRLQEYCFWGRERTCIRRPRRASPPDIHGAYSKHIHITLHAPHFEARVLVMQYHRGERWSQSESRWEVRPGVQALYLSSVIKTGTLGPSHPVEETVKRGRGREREKECKPRSALAQLRDLWSVTHTIPLSNLYLSLKCIVTCLSVRLPLTPPTPALLESITLTFLNVVSEAVWALFYRRCTWTQLSLLHLQFLSNACRTIWSFFQPVLKPLVVTYTIIILAFFESDTAACHRSMCLQYLLKHGDKHTSHFCLSVFSSLEQKLYASPSSVLLALLCRSPKWITSSRVSDEKWS